MAGKKRKNYVFIMFLILVALFAFYKLLPMYMEYSNTKASTKNAQEEYMKKELQKRELQSRKNKLHNDPEAIEREAREKLGWCKEDEKIYHFDPIEEN